MECSCPMRFWTWPRMEASRGSNGLDLGIPMCESGCRRSKSGRAPASPSLGELRKTQRLDVLLLSSLSSSEFQSCTQRSCSGIAGIPRWVQGVGVFPRSQESTLLPVSESVWGETPSTQRKRTWGRRNGSKARPLESTCTHKIDGCNTVTWDLVWLVGRDGGVL